MPSYQSNPTGNVPVQLLQPGIPSYAFGSLPTGPVCRLQVTSVARASSTATLQVKVVEGNIPAVGDLITVKATTQAAGAFNVTNATLTAVNINALTGSGSVQYAIGAGTLVDTADPGYAAVPITQLGETLATGASAAFAVPIGSGDLSDERTITWSLQYPTAPSAVNVALQASLVDLDSEYATLDTSTSTSGETRFITLTNFRFLRLKVVSVSVGVTVIGKILI